MWPYVIREPIEIGTYGVMMAIGFLTASWLLNKDLRRRNIDPGAGDVTIMIAIVLGVIGAKLAYLLTEAQHFTFKDFISGAGLTWHGGLILAAAGIVAYWVWKKYPIPVMLDAVAPLLASGYAFGRLGCLISGDGCYGVECSPDAARRSPVSIRYGRCPRVNRRRRNDPWTNGPTGNKVKPIGTQTGDHLESTPIRDSSAGMPGDSGCRFRVFDTGTETERPAVEHCGNR